MAELVTLLMLTVSQLLGAGVSAEELAAQVQQAVVEHPPAPIESVTVYCTPEQSTELGPGPGETHLLRFAFRGLMFEPLLLEEAEFIIGGVRLLEDGSLAIGSIEWWARIAEDDLTTALAAETGALGDAPEVRVTEDYVQLKGKYRALFAWIPFEVRGNLTVENQTQLVFSVDQSKMSGIPVPRQVNRLIEKEVNPVYDLTEFAARNEEQLKRAREQLSYEFHLDVYRITPAAERLLVEGTA